LPINTKNAFFTFPFPHTENYYYYLSYWKKKSEQKGRGKLETRRGYNTTTHTKKNSLSEKKLLILLKKIIKIHACTYTLHIIYSHIYIYTWIRISSQELLKSVELYLWKYIVQLLSYRVCRRAVLISSSEKKFSIYFCSEHKKKYLKNTKKIFYNEEGRRRRIKILTKYKKICISTGFFDVNFYLWVILSKYTKKNQVAKQKAFLKIQEK